MYFVRNHQDKSMYVFEVYEKWWYCFFLWFAWLLPHRLHKIDNYEERSLQRLEKDKQVGFWPIFGMIVGTILYAILPDEVFFFITEENIYYYYLFNYILSVFFLFFLRKVYVKKRIWTEDKSNYVVIRFNFLRFNPIYIPIFLFVIIGGCLIAFSVIREITVLNIIIDIGACFLLGISSFGIGSTTTYTTKEGDKYLLGPIRYFPE